jgi:acyl-CoA hydrolase
MSHAYPLRKPTDSEIIMTQLVLPDDTNQLGNLMGGRLMHWIDIAAALAAMKHTNRVCVTASVDEIAFLEPIRLGHIVTLYACVNRAFHTSIEVGVKIMRQDPLNGTTAVSSRAYLTFVAIDQYGKPIPVPSLSVESDEEKRRHEMAGLRREQRLKNREQLKEVQKRHSAEKIK